MERIIQNQNNSRFIQKKKKKYAPPPFHHPLKTNTLYHDPRFQKTRPEKAKERKREREKKKQIQKQSQTRFHYIISPSPRPYSLPPRFTIPAIRARLNGSTYCPGPSPTVLSSGMQRIRR